MQLAEVQHIFHTSGPFATVYLEGRPPAEDADQQIRLRWNHLREQLNEAGAEEGVLETLDAAIVTDDIGEVQADGRVLVANASGVILNEAWDAVLGAQDAAHFTDEPELGPYARERARAVRILLAVADQTGATVRHLVATEEHRVDELSEKTIGASSDLSVHKPREGALSHNQIQRRADEAVKQNVRAVADRLRSLAGQWRPDVVVLAGEVQGRTALRDELPGVLQENFREIDRGGIDDDTAEEALAEELRAVASDLAQARAEEVTERFEQAKAHNLAVEGSTAVAGAATMGAIETLLFEYERPAKDEGALLGASARVDANLGLTTATVDDGVAAILRFEIPDEVTT